MFKVVNGKNPEFVNEIFRIKMSPLMNFDKDHVFISLQLIPFSAVQKVYDFSFRKSANLYQMWLQDCLAASDLFHMFIQSIKFYTFHYHVLRVQMFEIHQIDSKNECLVASFGRSYGKICVGFCINTWKRFFLEVWFESQQKEHRFS